jgi:leucyl aminopeptidase
LERRAVRIKGDFFTVYIYCYLQEEMNTKIKSKSGDIFAESIEVLVIPILEDKKSLPAIIKTIDKKMGGVISEALADEDFSGKHKELLLLRLKRDSSMRRLLLLGMGKEEKLTIEMIRQAVGKAAVYVRDLQIESLTYHIPSFPTDKKINLTDLCQALSEAPILALYKFTLYKKTEPKEKKNIKEIYLWFDDKKSLKTMEPIISQSKIIAEATCYARDLTNQPANVVVPEFLATEAKKIAKDMGLDCHILHKADLQKLKMGAFLSVAQGSEKPANIIILQYNSKRDDLPNIALIGKGVTFDSGGICIKPERDMWQMKGDMAGAAAVLAAIKAAAQLQFPLKIIGVIPATENMPGGLASHPGDVVKSYSGKTIEIINTDAEGRMILADALAYALKYKPNAIIDLATLTGSCVVALGHLAIGLMGNNETLMLRIKEAGEKSYERVWELPLWEEYSEQIESDIADIKNSGGRYGGAITAAAFLKHFVDNVPWAHLDIAGVFWYEQAKPYIPKGATGIGVRLLIELLSTWNEI